MLKRGYSLIEVKSLNEERRELSGWASTPTVDRQGDIVEPLGARFSPDGLPLLMHHDPRLIVGRAQLGKPTVQGIPFTAQLPRIDEPGPLRDRVDEAWGLVKHRLCTGVSIGFRPINGQVERIEGGGLRFREFEIVELSIVPIPANEQATIQNVKALDLAGPIRTPATSKAGTPVFFDPKRYLQEILDAVTKAPPKDANEMFTVSLRTLGLHLATNAKEAHAGLVARVASLEGAVATLTQRLAQLESSGPPAVAIDIDRAENGLMSRITVTPTEQSSAAKAATEQVIAALVHSTSRGQ